MPNKILDWLKERTMAQKVAMGGITAIVLSVAIVALLWSMQTEYKVLYKDLTQEDAALIVERLKDTNVPYQLDDRGAISVPVDALYEARMDVAGAGLVKGGGVGFEIFDRTGFGVTEFVQKVNYQRALQGELSRTISSLNEVESARVHIVTPEKRLFAKRGDLARASVVLKLVKGRTLTRAQVKGVVNLVSASIDGLETANVTVVDVMGNLLSRDEDEESTSVLTATQFEYQTNVEKALVKRVEYILEPVLGIGKVIARVSAEVDFTKLEMTEEKFDPDGAVVRSEQSSKEKSTGGAFGGVPGVVSNVPGEQIPGGGSATSGSEKQKETINYEISKIISKKIAPTGVIKRLSVAVLVDGSYINNKDEEGNETRDYEARSDEDILKFKDLVKGAVGIVDSRGDTVEVVNIRFGEMETVDFAEIELSFLDQYLAMMIKYGSIVLIALLILLLFVRPTMKKLLTPPPPTEIMVTPDGVPISAEELEAMEMAMEMEGEEEEDLSRPMTPEARRKKSIRAMVMANPQQSSAILKNWLKDKGPVSGDDLM